MGFIESLRRQKELQRQEAEKAKQLADAKARREQELKLATDRQRVFLEEKERERVRQEAKKATEYFNKSDFTRLAQELARIEAPMIVVREMLYTELPRKRQVDFFRYGCNNTKRIEEIVHHESVKREVWSKFGNNNSERVLRIMRDVVRKTNRGSTIIDPANEDISKVGLTLVWYGGIVDFDAYSQGESWYDKYNIIPIGCDPEGTINIDIRKQTPGLFVSNLVTEINLPFGKWMGNPAVQEEALNIAYVNPRYVLIYQSTRPGRSLGLGEHP